MKNGDGAYLVIQAVVVSREVVRRNQQLSIEIRKHGKDVIETVRVNGEPINEIHSRGFFETDAPVLPSDSVVEKLSAELDPLMQSHDWIGDSSDWIHIRATMTCPSVGPNYIAAASQPTVVDMWLVNGGSGVFRVSNAISGAVFDMAPVVMHRAPIPVLKISKG